MTWIFALLISLGHAGFLRIVGTSQLDLDAKGSGLILQGEYRITNQGDEAARDVFPEFQLDRFHWQGEPKLLQAGETAVWRPYETIQKSQLTLAARGRFALSIFHHYSDMNGYSFAIPAVELLSLSDQAMPADLPSATMKIEAIESGQYSANLKIKNPGSQALKLRPLYLLPKEVELTTAVVPLEIAAGGELESSVLFQNQKGLNGSTYQAYVALQWNEGDERRAVTAVTSFRIDKNLNSKSKWNPDQRFWAWWLWALFVGLICMWIFWIRPLKRM